MNSASGITCSSTELTQTRGVNLSDLPKGQMKWVFKEVQIYPFYCLKNFIDVNGLLSFILIEFFLNYFNSYFKIPWK